VLGAIGRVLTTLDELGLTSSTAVIVHADHGQSLKEHDYFGHGRNVFDATARIPMIVRAPGRIPAGRRDSALARNVDILPTVLALLRLPDPVQGDGIDLFSASGGAPRETYIETYLSGTWLFSDLIADDTRVAFRRLGLRTPEWKFVINDPIQFVDKESQPLDPSFRRYYSEALYDLAADPGETRNRRMEHPEVAERLRQRVFDLQSLGQTKSQPMALDDGTRDKLKALGYLGE